MKFQIQSEAMPCLVSTQANAPAARTGGDAPEFEDSFVKFFDELRSPLFWYLRRIGLRPEEAEEVVQEVFLRLFERLGEKGGQRRMRRWVFRVAHNLAMDHHRQQNRFTLKSWQEWMELSDLLQDHAINPEERLLDEEQIARLNQAFAMLTSRQAQCLYLRMKGLCYREIGELLGVTVSTVAESLGLAIRKLRESEHTVVQEPHPGASGERFNSCDQRQGPKIFFKSIP
jgi:RNA polymerase sigma-70 factor, ECF subfamily